MSAVGSMGDKGGLGIITHTQMDGVGGVKMGWRLSRHHTPVY